MWRVARIIFITLVFLTGYLLLYDGKSYAFADSTHSVLVIQWNLLERIGIGLLWGGFIAIVGDRTFQLLFYQRGKR